MSVRLPVIPYPRQDPQGGQVRTRWGPHGDSVAGMWGHGAGAPRGAPSLGRTRSPSLPGKLHPQQVGQRSVYFRCASWVYSNFDGSPCPSSAPAQSHADHWPWANPGQAVLATPRGDESSPSARPPRHPPSPPRAGEGAVLAAPVSWEITARFIYIFFQPSVACGKANPPS